MDRAGKFVGTAATFALIVASGTTWAQQGAAGLPVGPFVVYPGVDFGYGHTDNLFSSNVNKRSSNFTTLAPYFNVEAKSRANTFNFLLRGEMVRYYQSKEDSYETFLAEGNANLVFTGRAGLKLKAAHQLGVDPRGSTDRPFGNDPDRWSNDSIEGSFAYGAPGAQGRIEVDAGAFRRRYDNNRLFTAVSDRDTSLLGGAFFWRVAPKTELLFNAQRTDIEYKLTGTTLNSTEDRLYVGVKWDATAKTSGTAKIGRLKKDFDSSTRQDFSGTSWDVGLRWSPLTYSVVDITTSKQTSESTGVGDAVLGKSYGAVWTHAWNTRFKTALQGNWRKDEFLRGNRTDDTATLGLKADYQFRRWLKFGAEYTWTDRSSNVNAFDYKRNLFLLTVGATM